jgi:Xaa-Pro aminopeptidase
MFDTKHSYEGVTIQKDDYLHVDIFLTYKGYHADMARVLNVGPVSETFKKHHEQCWRAFDAVVEKVKPGMTVRQLHRILYEAGGIETLEEMAGHGVGLDVHEPPMLTASSEVIIQPGMCVEVEPWIGSFRKQGGPGFVHVENLIIITERGCKPVLGLSREIMQVANPIY